MDCINAKIFTMLSEDVLEIISIFLDEQCDPRCTL